MGVESGWTQDTWVGYGEFRIKTHEHSRPGLGRSEEAHKPEKNYIVPEAGSRDKPFIH